MIDLSASACIEVFYPQVAREDDVFFVFFFVQVESHRHVLVREQESSSGFAAMES